MHGLLSIRGLAELGLGALLYEQRDLAATERHVTVGIELARRGLNERTVAVGYLVLATVRRAQDRSAEGIELLDRAQKWGFPEMILHVKAQRTRIARLQGDRGSLANAPARLGIQATMHQNNEQIAQARMPGQFQ
ncbi:MAG TPA: hypothetical protein VFG86_12335 [Chloroflexota bacterium]|jgi:hypothetical protein|nr:hypothetical protein [Chloroflexota bacterium]